MQPEIIIRVDTLAFEVTRKCNAECIHCLRGKQQDVCMPPSVIGAALAQIDEIYSVTATGGEPLMAPNITAGVYGLSFTKGAESFFLSTNGVISPFSEAGVMVLRSLLNYCDTDDIGEESRNTIQLSVGSYHPGASKDWNIMNVSRRTNDTKNPLNRGMAYHNGLDAWNRDISPLYFELHPRDEGAYEMQVDTIYINAYGQVFTESDLSYEMQEDAVLDEADWYLGDIAGLRATLTAKAQEKLAAEKCCVTA
jgi:hypothetical protein